MSETPLTPAKWLRDLPLGIKDEGFCDLLLDLRQELIDLNFIVTVLDLVEANNERLEHDPRIAFLHLVAQYHVGVRKGTNNALDWVELGEQFRAFPQLHAYAMLDFYLPNYALLSYRNSGCESAKELVPQLFREAADAAMKLSELQRCEAMGYLQYNVSRWMLLHGKADEALVHWESAGNFRVKWFEALGDDARPHTLLAAARQVWKARAEFLRYFPGADIDDCGVHADVYGVILTEFGEEALKSAASLK